MTLSSSRLTRKIQQCKDLPQKSKEKTGEQGNMAQLEALQNRIISLETENHSLKKQLEIVYGQLYQKVPAAK